MKNLFTKMMLVAVAAMTFIGCSQEPTEINATVKKTTIDLLVNIDDVTRSSFGDKAGDGSYPSVWNSYDSVQVYAVDANDNIIAKGYGNVEIPEGGDGSTAAVRATFDGVETFADLGVTKLYAYVGGWDFYASETALPVLSIKAEQTPASASVESGVHTLKAETEWDGSTGQVNLTFSHAAAYGRMVLPQFEGTAVKSVEITLNGTTTTLDTRNLDTNVYWFATEAIDEVTTFSVTAVSGLFTYSKEIDMTGKTLKFITGQVSEFSVKDLVKEELTADAEVTFTDMAYDSENDLWKFTNADGDYAYIPFVTETKGELVSGTYTAASDMNTVGTYNANNTVVKYGTKPETYPGFNYGDITVTVDGINVNVDILFEIYDETDTTDYKSLFHGVYSIVAPTGEFATELATVKSMYYSPETSRSLWITTETTPAGVFSIFLTLSVGEDGEAFAVIPEGTYTFGADSGFAITTDSHANIETAEQYVNISEGTLTVSHVGEEYKLVLDITNAEDAHITATWQGVITGQWTWANDIPHPGYVLRLDTPSVEASVQNRNEIVVTWNEITNAASYTVSCEGQSDVTVEAGNTLTATFTGLDYETEYTVSVVANPAADSAYSASEAGAATATTLTEEFEARNITFTSAELTYGKLDWKYIGITFTTEAGDSLYTEINLSGTTIDAVNGTYSGFSGSAANTFYSIQFTPAGGEQLSADIATMTVTNNDPNFEFAMNFNLSDGTVLVGSYSGKVTGLSNEVLEDATIVSAAATDYSDANYKNVTFTFSGGDSLVVYFKTDGNAYLETGAWQTANWQEARYISYAYYNGNAVTINSMDVAYENDQYVINMAFVVSGNTITASYTGTIENLTAPEAGSGGGGDVINYTIASGAITDSRYGDVKFYDANGDEVLYFCINPMAGKTSFESADYTMADLDKYNSVLTFNKSVTIANRGDVESVDIHIVAEGGALVAGTSITVVVGGKTYIFTM